MSREEILILAIVSVGLVLLLWLLWVWARAQRRGLISPQNAYTQGLSSLISGNRRAALHQLKEAIQHDSDNLDAYIRLGDLLRESGEVEKATAVHRDLTVRPRLEDADRARILESLARDYLAAEHYEEAGQCAERLRHIDRTNRFAHRALQEAAESLKDWPRAIRVVEERAKLEGQRDRLLLARYHGFVGSEELEAGNPKEARKRFEEALKLDPECLLASLYLGDMAHREGNPDKAVEHWQSVALTSPEHGNLVFDRLERAFFELGRFEDVMTFYRELLERAPRETSVPALLALAEIQRRKGNLEDSESFANEALEIEPDNPRAYRHLVKLAMDRKDPAQALTQVDRLLDSLTEDESPGDCRHCGRSLPRPVWRCAQCRGLNPMGL
jgi:lipopolysaccharide biosynthesis regulator YciM